MSRRYGRCKKTVEAYAAGDFSSRQTRDLGQALTLAQQLFGNYYAPEPNSKTGLLVKIVPIGLCLHCLMAGELKGSEIELFLMLRKSIGELGFLSEPLASTGGLE